MHRNFIFIGLFVILFVMLFSGVSITRAQTVNYTADSRLYECMDKEYIDQLSYNKSELILYYNYYLDNSYYVVHLNAEKPVTGVDIHTVRLSGEQKEPVYFSEKTYNPEFFNPFKYTFTLQQKDFSTYIWNEAGIAIVFRPLTHIKSGFQNFLQQYNTSK